MSLLRPFQAYLPAPELAAMVVTPPLGSLTTIEWLKLAADNPVSFLHVIRTEVDSEDGELDTHVCEHCGRERLDEMIDSGVLQRFPSEAFYVYRVDDGIHAATCIVAEVDVAGFGDGRIRRHEHTRASTENLLVEHLGRVRAHSDPIALAHRAHGKLAAEIEAVTNGSPDLSFVTERGSTHQVWAVAEPSALDRMQRHLDALGPLYLTDGHHRASAAARFAERHPPFRLALAAVFSGDALRLRAFHRCLDLQGESATNIVEAVRRVVPTEELGLTDDWTPRERGTATLVAGDRGFRITLPELVDTEDPRARLDVVRLQRGVLEPVFGVTDPRTDPRLRYVSDEVTADAAQHGCDVCFMVRPPDLDDVICVADAGLVMPPKSTRFGPKVAGGLFISDLDAHV